MWVKHNFELSFLLTIRKNMYLPRSEVEEIMQFFFLWLISLWILIIFEHVGIDFCILGMYRTIVYKYFSGIVMHFAYYYTFFTVLSIRTLRHNAFNKTYLP